MNVSGKLVIIGILTVALASAVASWWFRYAATHRAAKFWGPEATRLIRDAPIVELYTLQRADDVPATLPDNDADSELQRETVGGEVRHATHHRDVSAAPGMTHLRNALLEDRSFHWSAPDGPPEIDWTTVLQFRHPDAERIFAIMFSHDFQWARASTPHAEGPVSMAPIAAGLREMFAELSVEPQAAR